VPVAVVAALLLVAFATGSNGGRPIGQVHTGALAMTPTLVPYQGGAGLGAVGVF
jgi:hypothetical protein